jgi:putative membrane protein
MRRTMILVVLIAFVCMTGCTPADNTNSTSTSNANTTNSNTTAAPTTTPASRAPARDDRAFVMEVAQNGIAEIALGRLAAQKGRSPEVKRFAQRVISDHSKVAAELKQLATTKGITLPADMKPEQKQTLDRLATLSGAEFDRDFMTLMAENHDKSVSTFREVARDGTDPDIKAFAAKTLPTLQEHQKMAHDIHGKLTS